MSVYGSVISNRANRYIKRLHTTATIDLYTSFEWIAIAANKSMHDEQETNEPPKCQRISFHLSWIVGARWIVIRGWFFACRWIDAAHAHCPIKCIADGPRSPVFW